MFKKSNKQPQLDMFGSIHNMLDRRSLDQFNDEHSWHNQFRKEIVSRLDESIFKVLFNDTIGAPNAPISLLFGMITLKEGFGYSDAQLYEQCRFNLLIRAALGLFNINDTVPTESTYYLFRKRIHEHMRHSGEDLLQKAFASITQKQVLEFHVDGRSIRMDSKLIGSNIAYFSRYEIIHQTLISFYKSLSKTQHKRMASDELKQLKDLAEEDPGKTVYRSSREEITSRMQALGYLIYRLIVVFKGQESEPYHLLLRVFHEQYRLDQQQKIQLRPKEEMTSDSLQSPHDPDSSYSHKKDQRVKGYKVNLTETVDQDSLNLITSVLVDKANVSEVSFVQPSIEESRHITAQKVERVHADGAYQSPSNDRLCQDIDMVFSGLQGFSSRYDLQMTSDGLLVSDTKTGQNYQALPTKKNKNSKEQSYYIDTNKKRVYFSQQAIRASDLRRQYQQRTREELNKRKNVEASIFQLAYHLRNKKSRYRGLIKQKFWLISRCLWINLVRIANFIKQTCQRPEMKSKMAV